MLDFLAQAYYRFKVPLFEWKEQQWVARQFYHDAAFKALDQELLSGPNPYISAKVFPYGETPLRALYAMAQAIDLKPTDHFVDLGCGRGRAVFFLSRFFGCQATGIDLTPSFIHKAERLAKNHRQKKVTFLCQDFTSYDFQEASCVYLYGTTYSDECLAKLEDKLLQLPEGRRIVTVSEPLKNFRFAPELGVLFAWGKGIVFLHTSPACSPSLNPRASHLQLS